MKKLCTILLLLPFLAQAQTGTINGRVISATTGQGLAFVNVVANTTIGTSSAEDGNFSIQNIPYGTYTVNISCVGYEINSIPQVTVSANNPTVDLGAIKLNLTAIMIEEITISEQQKVYDTRFAGTNNVISLKKIKQIQ